MRSIDTGLWVHESAVRSFGLSIPCRMVVVESGDGALWLHSPMALTETADQLNALGRVTWRVAPNAFHHLGQTEYQQAFPDSRLAAPTAVAGKRRDLRVDVRLDEAPPDLFGEHWRWRMIPGSPGSECVFLHRPSASLIITDLAMRIDDGAPLPLRLYGRLGGIRSHFGVNRVLRLMYRRRDQARRAIEDVLGWEFQRIIPAHGPIVDRSPRVALSKAFQWLSE
jgi:hypothetical protein